MWWGSGLGGGLVGMENMGVNVVSSLWDWVVVVLGVWMILGCGFVMSIWLFFCYLIFFLCYVGMFCRIIVMVFIDGI